MGNVRGHITVRRAAKPGADGKSVEMIFKTTSTSAPPDAPLSEQVDDYVPSGWNDDPEDISNEYPYLFMCKRVKTNDLWGEYSTPAIWAKYSGVEPKAVTLEQLLTLMNEGMLDSGAKYIITDHPNDEGIIVEAVSSSLINSKATRLGCKPKYYTAGTRDDEDWYGVLDYSESTVVEGGLYVYAGMVYRNLTGENNTDFGQNEYKLSSYDWELIPPAWGAYYSPNICQCQYSISPTLICGAIHSMTDISGNTYGELLIGNKTLDELTRIDYNDWGHPGISYTQVAHCWGNMGDCDIYKVSGKVDIFQNKECSYSNLRCGEEMASETFPYLWNGGNKQSVLHDCDISGHIFSNTNLSLKKSAVYNSIYSNSNLSCESLVTYSRVFSNSSLTFNNCRFLNKNHDIRNIANTDFSNIESYGRTDYLENCLLSSFRILSPDAYVTDCEYLEITNSSLSGISWIKTITGTPESKVVVSGSEIGGELEELGAGFIIEDIVLGKSGDIKRVGAGHVKESRIDGDFKDIGILEVDNSNIGTQSDINDWVAVTIADSVIGAKFIANMPNPPQYTLSVTNSVILPGTTLYQGNSSITTSSVGGMFSGTALNSNLEADYKGSIEDSVLFKAKVVCPYIERSHIYADLNAAACYDTVIEKGATVYTDGAGGFYDCVIQSTAEINMRSSAPTVFTRCKIAGKISQLGLSEMTYFTDCVLDYGAVFDDHSVKEYNNCRFKKNFHVSDAMLVLHKIYDSVLDGVLSLSSITSDTCLGRMSAHAYLVGEIELPSSSSTYLAGTYVSGGTPQIVKSNGIAITNSSGFAFTVEKAGWYRVDYVVSAFAASKGLLDTKAFIVGTPDVEIPQSYISMVYPANTEMANSGVRFLVYLTDGQSVVFRYRQNYTASLSVQISNLILNVEKEVI